MARRFTIAGAIVFAVFAQLQPSRAPAQAASFDQAIGTARASVQIDPRKAIAAARNADLYVSTVSDPEKKIRMHATVQWLMGEAYLRMEESAVAVPLIERAYETINRFQPNTVLHGELLISMGAIAMDRGDASAALVDYLRAHRIFRQTGQTRSQVKVLIQIAILYYDANDWGSALRYLNQALDSSEIDPGLSFAIHNCRALIFKEQGHSLKALEEFGKTIEIARELKSPLLVATALNNISRVYLAAGDLAAADRAIAQSRRESGRVPPPEFAKQQDATAAQLALQRRDYRGAAALIGTIFADADLTKTTLDDREAHRTAYLTYRALGRDDLALAHLIALKRLDDDATKLARSTGAALMSARFDFANQSLRIAKLKAQDAEKTIAFERAAGQSQRIMFYGASGAVLLVILLLLHALRTSRRSRVKVQKAADALAVTNDALGKALAAKTEFLATTSHEIRTPLNGILGMTQVMLADGTLGAATLDRVGVVHEAGLTMRALVDDILDVAKMETGNLTIEHAPFDLKATMLDVTRLWAVQAEAKGLSFVRTLDDCPTLICGDAARVRQIVFNLLSNALKFTAAGSVTLTIERSAEDRYRIMVADSGIGIAPDKLETIFESFRQADTSTTRQFGGTGLGLSICRNLARAMGGDVTVESRAGAGATFIVDLPLIAAKSNVVAPCAQADAVDLLILDRNPISRNMLKALLAPHFATIGFAASIDEAIESLVPGSATLVLVDDATVRVGDPLPDLGRLVTASDGPVALLWPVSANSERDELLATGIDAVVAKPVTGASLVGQLVAMRGIPSVPALVSKAA